MNPNPNARPLPVATSGGIDLFPTFFNAGRNLFYTFYEQKGRRRRQTKSINLPEILFKNSSVMPEMKWSSKDAVDLTVQTYRIFIVTTGSIAVSYK